MFSDFSLILFAALVITGGIWLIHAVLFKQRVKTVDDDSAAKEPLLVEYSKAFFPVILIVFVLRSFIVEPFRIPSGSMLPSLEIGDFILVNKFSYGIRLPIINSKVLPIDEPERGDVMVFRYPVDEKTNFIKRVIGLPGDVIEYTNKKVLVNGQELTQSAVGEYSFMNSSHQHLVVNRFKEQVGDRNHDILLEDSIGSRQLRFEVPDGKYFVMGDNRDHSNDSRRWGFVPEANIVGKAFFVWFNLDTVNDTGVNWSRIGTTIE